MSMVRTTQHPNVCSSTKNTIFTRLHHNNFYFWMLKPHPLYGISQFNIDTQIIRIQFQLVTFKKACRFINVHYKTRDGSLVFNTPMAIHGRICLKVYKFRHCYLSGLLRFYYTNYAYFVLTGYVIFC